MNIPSLRFLFAGLLLVATALADKPRITSQDQLPRFSYEFSGKVTDVVTNDDAYASLAVAVRADLEKLLNDYDIADRTTLQGILLTLMTMDLHAGDFVAARAKLAAVREMEEKPASRLTTGLLADSYMAARESGDYATEDAFRAAFARIYAAKLQSLPWAVVADNLKSARASAEIISEALIVGNLEAALQPGVDKAGSISGDVATTLINQRVSVAHYLPLKAERVAALAAIIEANQVEKPNIWPERDITLAPDATLTPVVVAIWDSGLDPAVLPGQLWTNPAEQADGADTDGNGYVDDIHGIAYDMKSNPVPELLVALSEEQMALYPTARNWTKGLLDLQASIDSPESAALRQHLAGLAPADVQPFIESLNLFGNYTHGTHVAGIAAAGNPAIRVLTARLTFDHRMIPDVPTREQAEKDAAAARAVVAYFRQHGVRVVNMSWGGSPRGIEAAFEANGTGGTPEERRQLSRELFELARVALTEAMREAPEILFIAAAGNSDNDAAFEEFIPSGIDLPNVLTVGAVDQAGEETSFTSFGANVDVHANGFEVESWLPGGERMKYSGTSMAAPNVANLAGKLLALDPSLDVAALTALIMDGAERSADGRINLINPRRSFDLLRTKTGN
ncbi:MAG TPA: S8 family serine peptidase [Opitutaceae bacterium]|nr:S8 family serine peptidase [Opitutaceae bacterium]HRJ47972.1 S8 family serine peptidase [Opitutaceae bacterium]